MCAENKDKRIKSCSCRKSYVMMITIYSILLSIGFSITNYSEVAAKTIFSTIEVDGKPHPVEKYGVENLRILPIIILTEEGLKKSTAYGFTKEEIMIPWLKKNDLYDFYQRLQKARQKISKLLPHETIKLSKANTQKKKSGRTLFLYDTCEANPHNPAMVFLSGESSIDLRRENPPFNKKTSAVRHTGSTHAVFTKKRFRGLERWFSNEEEFHCLEDYLNDNIVSVFGE